MSPPIPDPETNPIPQPGSTQPLYCDVALPVPIDQTFTYAISDVVPLVGGRVLVPFRREQMQGVVIALHSEAPPAKTRALLQVLDREEAALSEDLLALGRWIASYYLTPLGEVLRTMLPLASEVRRQTFYRITEGGRRTIASPVQSELHEASGCDIDHAVLTYLAEHGDTQAGTLRAKLNASAAVLDRLLATNRVERESTVSAWKTKSTTHRVAVLVPDLRLPRLREHQQRLLAELASSGGRMPVRKVEESGFSRSTLGTLARHGLVRLEDAPEDSSFDSSETAWSGSPLPAESELNRPQREAIAQIAASVHARTFQSFLLHGVTGSGKTAVYMAAMQRALNAGLSSLMLVPEIGLTPATVAQLRSCFGDEVALLHSALTATERTAQWRRIQHGQAHIVVGTRSAIFAPIANLALIVVDEEHDTSYKQGELPRYHGRDVAVMRAKLSGATIVLGSATPSLESWTNAQRGKYSLLTLGERVGGRPMPEVTLIDMRQEFVETGQDHLVSRVLAEEIEATLGRGEQAMLLLNRRGYSLVLMCRACGEKLQCENCAIALTYHKSIARDDGEAPSRDRLECHYCGFRRGIPRHCPACGSEHLYYFGVGSEQGEERLQEMFPHARIARMDRDTMRHHQDYERILTQLQRGEINLLVGTQMIAKGHDIHGVTLVGVIGIDHALSLPDFRSAERAFQLLTQAAGRAGRGTLPGKVLVQTHHLDHYAIQFAAKHDYAGFAEKELRYRRLLHYPPAAVLTNVLIEHSDLARASHWAAQIGHWFQHQTLPNVRVLGPAASPIARIKRIHRFHLILKSSSRKPLAAAVGQMLAFTDSVSIPRKHITVDVDAVQLM